MSETDTQPPSRSLDDHRTRAADGTTPTESVSSPARFSTAFVLVGTLLVTGVLVAETGLAIPVFVGVVGSGSLAAALWFVARDRWRLPATLLTSLLLFPAGSGLAVGIGYTLLKQLSGSFAVGSVFVVLGLTVGAFGAAAAVRDVLTTSALRRLTAVTATTLAVPLVAFLGLALAALATLTPFEGVFDEVGRVLGDLFVTPTPATEPHLLTFSVLAVAAALTARWALRHLPLVELAPDDAVESVEATLAAADRSLLWAGFGGLVLAVLGVLAAIPTDPVVSRFPPALTRLLTVVSNAPSLRRLCLGVVVVAVVTVAAIGLAKRLARADDRTLRITAAVLGGSLLVAGATADPAGLVDWLLSAVVDLLPADMAGEFAPLATSVVEFYGAETVVLGVLTVTLVVAGWVVFGLLLGSWVGFLSGRAAAAGVAGSGLFVAAALAKTVGVDAPLVLGALVVSLVVWDAGDYAVAMGREVGHRATSRQTELVHVGGSLLVGTVAAAGVLALSASVPRLGAETAVPTLVALGAAVVGVVFLALSLR